MGKNSADVPDFDVDFGVTETFSTSLLARALQACRNLLGVSFWWRLLVPSNRMLKTIAEAAPNLRELSIASPSSPIFGQEFIDLLRSHPHLKSLAVRGVALSHFDGEDPVAFALEDLNLSGAIDASSFFEFVTPLSNSSLRSLTLPSFAPGSDTPILALFSRLATLYLILHSLTPDPTPILVQLPLLPLGHLSINNNFSPPISSFAFLPTHPRTPHAPQHRLPRNSSLH